MRPGADNDVEMDGGPVKDGDVDSRGQPALPPEKANLCQYSGPVYKRDLNNERHNNSLPHHPSEQLIDTTALTPAEVAERILRHLQI